ncbi:MAG TPA: hypothetical protein VH600_05840 [Burkholderiales bacterium]|jgi:hypothetical protein
MSIIHRLDDDELADVSLAELYATLGERDTPCLYDTPYTVDASYDCPFGAGNSVDRRIKYVDRTLYAEAMDGVYADTGLTPAQLIGRWLDHEHIEKCCIDGDNPCDIYGPGHRRALAGEHHGVLVILGPDDAREKIGNYEVVIWPGLVRCYNRPVARAPADLWCGPLSDEPEARDREILAALAELGVEDARKRGKRELHYGLGNHDCEDCRHWLGALPGAGEGLESLAPCEVANGLVRHDRFCDAFAPRAAAGQGNRDRRRQRAAGRRLVFSLLSC